MSQGTFLERTHLYHLNNPWLGQRIDEQGYLVVDETCRPIAENRVFGDENEEYGRYWTGRFGPLETHRYRYHESMIRTLQMRRNYVWMSAASVDMDPALTAYVSLALGRRVQDSPDAFCYLRESTVKASAAGKQGKTTAIRNFERWLYQRDREGYRTKPAVRAAQHEMMWMVPQGSKSDWIARRTDIANGNRRIGLALDDRFLSGGPHSVAVKVTYHDRGNGRWALVYTRPGGSRARATDPVPRHGQGLYRHIPPTRRLLRRRGRCIRLPHRGRRRRFYGIVHPRNQDVRVAMRIPGWADKLDYISKIRDSNVFCR